MGQNEHPPATKEGHPNLASPFVIVDGLRNPVDARQRIRAINAFVKRLSRGESFQSTWSAAGGAAGLAKLMADFSVNEVHRLCRQLGRTASAINAQVERRDGLGELVAILTSGETDPRPLGDYYRFIVPACHDSVVNSWETQATHWTRMQRRWMALGHRRLCEQRFLSVVFSKDNESAKSGLLSQHQILFLGNTPFCEAVLIKLGSLDSNDISIPSDFLGEFVLPPLRRLANPRSPGSLDDLHRCLDLVVRCCQKHARHLSKALSLDDPKGLVQFVAQRWIDDTGKDRNLFKQYTESLHKAIGPIPELSPNRLYSLMQGPKHRDAFSRYELLCILLQYLVADGSDLVNDSSASLQGTKSPVFDTSRSHLWPAEMFLCLPPDKSLALFLRLKRLHQSQSFIKRPASNSSTILTQEQAHNSRTTDLDTVETVLRRRAQPNDRSWLENIRIVIKKRIQTATESREAAERGFWIKSAINLCVAAQELQMLAECMRLARRLTNDPHASHQVWGLDYLATNEFLQLLTIVPEVTESSADTAQLLDELSSTAEENMAPAHNVVLTLLQTAFSAVGGPGFREGKWTLVIGLPALVAQRRERGVQAIRKRALESPGLAAALEQNVDEIMSKAVWKPTIKQLLEVEALMTAPTAPKPWASKWQAPNSPLGLLMPRLQFRRPALLAEMTQYCLESIRASLPPGLARAHMSSVASMTIRLAKGSQSSLALPFIQTIIKHSDYSVDPRRLLTHRLLSSLPSDTAREFLQSTVSTFTEVMARLNNQTEEGLVEQQISNESKRAEEKGGNDADNKPMPGIKVTTIKMMAQLLNETVAVGTSASFEMLASLLQEARHIDARIEIVRSLIGTLEARKAKPALRARVLDILELHILPIASQLDARRPISEADWRREDGVMPEVSTANPVFGLLLEGLSRRRLQPADHARLAALVMEALEQSAQTNRRWMSVFVEKNGFGEGMFQDMPVASAHINQLVSTFAQEINEMPGRIFMMLKDVILINILPPASLLRVTHHVKADASLRASNAGQHWLRQYDNPGSAAYALGLDQALRLLSEVPLEEADSEKILKLRGLLFAAADRCIRGGDSDAVHFLVDRIVENPSRPSHATNSGNAIRSAMVREIISSVEQAYDKEVATLHLPDMFLLQLALLKLTAWDGGLRIRYSHEPTIRVIVKQISDLVDLLVSRSPQPYHIDFDLLKRQVATHAKDLPGFARIAIVLGRLSGSEGGATKTKPSLAGYLRLELAAEGLSAAIIDPKDAGLNESAQLLVQEWSESSDVVVKRTGLRVAKALQDQQGRIGR